MPHPAVENATGFPCELLFLADEAMQPVCTILLQASWGIGVNGTLERLADPVPIDLAGSHHGDPATSSVRMEAPIAFFKPRTDVVMLGHAHAPSAGASEAQVGLRIGPLQKIVRVSGDRVMSRTLGRHAMSRPQPFETIPLVYERAFGGTDTREAVDGVLRGDVRNPVGQGWRDPKLPEEDEVAVPNIEDPEHPFIEYGQTPPPAGFGFIAPHWQPRAAFAGTYDEVWDQSRKPLLPLDFDRRFFNAASHGLVAPGYLRGDEAAVILNASPEGRLDLQLPDTATPWCDVELRGRRHVEQPLILDTVIIDLDTRRLLLQRRTFLPLQRGPEDIVSVRILPRRPS